MSIEFEEENIIHAKSRLKRIKAIADTLITLERNGYTDELYQGTLHNLMYAIDSQVDDALALLKY